MAKTVPILILIVFLWVILGNSLYVVNEWEQVVVTQFGRPVGEPVTSAGLKLKKPFVQKVNRFEERILEWDGSPNQVPTKDKRYIWVDTTARWRIADPLKFLQTVRNELGAHARLDDIIDSTMRGFITNNHLIEMVRDSNRILRMQKEESPKTVIEEPGGERTEGTVSVYEEIQLGRQGISRAVLARASQIMPQYGIELVDVRIKRINYVEEVAEKVYERMISERKREAEKYRSQGRGKSAEIKGEKERELKKIESQAYRRAQEIKGEAEAEATGIYAEAYGQDPEFYAFLKTLESYKNAIKENTRLILTTESEFYHYLKDIGK